MEKLTLEQIAPFLPYGLKMWRSEKIWPLTGLNNRVEFQLLSFGPHELNPIGCKAILRPMDLTKPIIVEGKEVIPVVELAKIVIPNPSEEAFGGMNWFEYEGEAVLYDTGMESGYLLKYVNGCFVLEGHDYSAYCPDQLDLFQWLFKHKFDVFGIIEKGLAIDVNTLEINPYN